MTTRVLPGSMLLAAVLFAAFTSRAQLPIDVEGVTDRSYSAAVDRATIRVPSANGYSYCVLLDNTQVPTDVWISITNVDYHELSIWRTNLASLEVSNRLVRFIVRSAQREGTENGLPLWTPYPTINSTAGEFAGARLKLMVPERFPTGYEIPVVAWVVDEGESPVRANGWLQSATGQRDIQIKRGVGSGFLAATNPEMDLNYRVRLTQLETNKYIILEGSTSWTEVSGVLAPNTVWPDNSRIHVTRSITIPYGGTLTIGAGTIIRLTNRVDITNNGSVFINGLVDRPVVFMPNTPTQPWGGFVMHTNNFQLVATGTIFTGSGAEACWFNSQFCAGPGPHAHRSEQALWSLKGSNGQLTFTDSAAIRLAGQFGHAYAPGDTTLHLYAINLTRFVMQGQVVGGEFTGSDWTANDSAFMNSHLLSMPFQDFNNGDEDGIYLVNGTHAFTNCLFGWVRDDGIDSGGSGPGQYVYKNCWFESIYHEGNSLSGVQNASPHADKNVRHIDGVFMNTGQALENGYGAVTSRVEHSLMLGNLVGMRFGDNYDWQYYGTAIVSNSILINNYRDVWGMTWQPGTLGWYYRTNAMDVRSNFLGVPNIYHPANAIWNPATDGWRLASFMSTPPQAAVGIGFAVWTNQFPLGQVLQGVPVGLSCFTTNTVTVDYQFLNDNGLLAGGTLTFAPGEIRKLIYPSGFNLADQSDIRVVLSNPTAAELTSESSVRYLGSVPTPRLVSLVAGSQADLARLSEGVAIALTNGPSAQTVSIDYVLEAPGQIVASGTLAFQPGQTLQWLQVPGLVPQDYTFLRLRLLNPVGIQSVGPTNYYFVKTIYNPATSPVTLLPVGATWKYIDTGANLGLAWSPSNPTGWTGTNYDDLAWPSGRAPLGFGYGGLERTTNRSGFLTYYFRTSILVSNAAALNSLTFRLLRDDSAAVYLNGAEVYRDNLPPGVITNQTRAVTNVSGSTSTYYVTTVSPASLSQPLHDGTNTLAVEIHQTTTGSSDIILDLELTGTPQPPGAQPPYLAFGCFEPGKLMLGWNESGFALQQATNLLGPFSTVGTASPLLFTPTNHQTYFRLRK